MVLIGHTKFGQNNRISLIDNVPDLLNLEMGDYVEIHVINGELVLRKETKKYNGYDFESDEIKEKLTEFEKEKLDECESTDMDPELAMAKGREEYLRDKAAREQKKQKR